MPFHDRRWHLPSDDANASLQAENFDAEVEELQPNKKKGKPPPRLVHAEESASRHRTHVKRLEQVLFAPSAPWWCVPGVVRAAQRLPVQQLIESMAADFVMQLKCLVNHVQLMNPQNSVKPETFMSDHLCLEIAKPPWMLQILRLLDNEAIDAEDLSEVQSSVADYLERNQEDFDFFSCPDDSYVDVLEQLDNLEVCS